MCQVRELNVVVTDLMRQTGNDAEKRLVYVMVRNAEAWQNL